MAYKIIKEEYCPYSNDKRQEYICDADADFNDLPVCCTGSTAVSVETGNVYVVNASGEWVLFGGE